MSDQDCVPKLIGGDLELANFILGENESPRQSDFEASRLLLSEVEGLPRRQIPVYGNWVNAFSSGSYGEHDGGFGYAYQGNVYPGGAEGRLMARSRRTAPGSPRSAYRRLTDARG